MQNEEKKSEHKSHVTSANIIAGNDAAQLKDNREHSVLQKKLSEKSTDQELSITTIQRKNNTTGLPDNLKSGIENLSGHSMDDVKVHYNSAQPAQLNAHAYAQGTDIHVASGQEKHLPHEAWHVVQQKEGRIKPTMQMKGKVNINDDKGLENEADVMGAKAVQLGSNGSETVAQKKLQEADNLPQSGQTSQLQAVVQMGGAGSKAGSKIVKPLNKMTYRPGQITNTALFNLMQGNSIPRSQIITHGTAARRDSLRGETDPTLRTNPGTTGEFVHFAPSIRNDYGYYVYVFRKDAVKGFSRNADYLKTGEVSTADSEGFYTQDQIKKVEERGIMGDDLEAE
jgi:hypothetical protein